MYIVHVFIEVKPGDVQDFIEATLANAKASIQEAGIERFDVLQNSDDSTRFLLVEVYRTKNDTTRHKETSHYKLWKDTVEEMMAVPRTKQIYNGLFVREN